MDLERVISRREFGKRSLQVGFGVSALTFAGSFVSLIDAASKSDRIREEANRLFPLPAGNKLNNAQKQLAPLNKTLDKQQSFGDFAAIHQETAPEKLAGLEDAAKIVAQESNHQEYKHSLLAKVGFNLQMGLSFAGFLAGALGTAVCGNKIIK